MGLRRRSEGANTSATPIMASIDKPARATSARRSWLATMIVVVMALCSLMLYARWQPLGATVLKQSVSPETSTDRFRLNPPVHSGRQPKTLTYRWRITSDERRPDGVLKRIFLINDQFPGPTIEARSGDRVKVMVENALIHTNENISMHWHGLSMRGYNDMDGAVGMTQDAIPPGQNFTYDFKIADDQAGTFWYHAHNAVQRADGLYGGFVVHEPASRTRSKGQNSEYLLMLGDWYHRSAEEILNRYLTADSFGMEPVPDSILVNGNGHFPCENAVPARPLDCRATSRDTSSLHLDGPRVSRLRVINVGAYSGLSVTLNGAEIRPIAVDGGGLVDSRTIDTVGILHPGERVDLSVEKWTSAKPRLSVALSTKPFKYSNPALGPEQSFRITLDKDFSPGDPNSKSAHTPISLTNLSSQTRSSELPDPDLTLMLYTMTEKLAHLDYVPTGNINRTIWKPQSPPLLSTDRRHWDRHQFVPHIPYREGEPLWVELVVNNLDEEAHPFHLHGHDFHVMATYSSATNWGSYNPFDGTAPPGGGFAARPLRKDTVAVPRRGYAVLRFRADNPGIWMFHCHVLWHLAGGMAMGFEVS